MLRTIQIISVIFCLIIITACSYEKDKDHATHEHKSEIDTDSHAIHEDGIDALHLNNGQKWQMDKHTRTLFKKMSDTFSAADQSDLPVLKQSAHELQNQIAELINGCTMTGEAHEQLHVFLSVYIPEVQSLTSASDFQAAETAAAKISELLHRYTDFFE